MLLALAISGALMLALGLAHGVWHARRAGGRSSAQWRQQALNACRASVGVAVVAVSLLTAAAAVSASDRFFEAAAALLATTQAALLPWAMAQGIGLMRRVDGWAAGIGMLGCVAVGVTLSSLGLFMMVLALAFMEPAEGLIFSLVLCALAWGLIEALAHVSGGPLRRRAFDLASQPCHRCGYDLRGTPDRPTCPECGATRPTSPP